MHGLFQGATMDSVLPNKPVPSAVDEPASRAEPEQEIDVWWGAYAGRTMLPSFLLCGLLSVLIAAAATYAWRAYDLPPLLVRYIAYALVGFLWFIQLSRWVYRILTRTYRLTTRRLLLEKTFRYARYVAVELRHVTDVRADQTPLERRLGVGRLHLSVVGCSTP